MDVFPANDPLNKKVMNKSFEIKYQIYHDLIELGAKERQLLDHACKALEDAYAPYSGFAVAASLLLEDGQILVGTNQENASYGLSLCAEQNVLAMAGSRFKSLAVKMMAVTAHSQGKTIDHPISPCGACRQVISEHEDRHQHAIKIILRGASGPILVFESVKDLLPFSFSGKDLG
jgi:cytidine deaminase